MLPLPRFLLLAVVGLTLGACASRPLPKYEKPLARAAVQKVRTTAYTHTESDHLEYGQLSAAGTPLKFGEVRSAAADWSRWPKGTLFRVVETGEIREVDDYGWALSGTNTIDLYEPSKSDMNSWGVRRVNIEILRWGDAWQSHAILRDRAKYAHVRRMLKQIEERYPRGREGDAPVIAAVAPAAAAATVAGANPVHGSVAGVPLQPFNR
jgi:3D (Asp-Asp-Asp) domain-containing protein